MQTGKKIYQAGTLFAKQLFEDKKPVICSFYNLDADYAFRIYRK